MGRVPSFTSTRRATAIRGASDIHDPLNTYRHLMPRLIFLLPLCAILLLSACSSPSYRYRPIPGRTGELRQGYAIPPAEAPPTVQAAIAAGNRIAGLPYCRGGGHGCGTASAYDCSGSASYVLREAGLLRDSMPSGGFRRYGKPGEGEWISVYARNGHVFLVVAGLRFDTGWNNAHEGPRWSTLPRPCNGCVVRHPDGF